MRTAGKVGVRRGCAVLMEDQKRVRRDAAIQKAERREAMCERCFTAGT